jgi:hypothetical protein
MGYFLLNYITTSMAINYSNKIDYNILKSTASFWRGTKYILSVKYNDEVYKTQISEKMHDSIELGLKPVLYYNQNLDKIVNSYEKSLMLKIIIVVSILAIFLFSFVYYQKKN